MLKLWSTILLFFSLVLVNAQNLNVGDDFPIKKLENYKNSNNLKIVVFTPSLYKDNAYASMLTTSLYYYFVQGLAFDSDVAPSLDVIYVVNDEDQWAKNKKSNVLYDSSNQNKLDQATVIYDKDGLVYTNFGLKPFNQKTTNSVPVLTSNKKAESPSSILFLLDKKNKILLKDTDYRAQGEHLKPLEKLVKSTYKIDEVSVNNTNKKVLKVGDKAPDFLLTGPNFSNDSKLKLLDDKKNYKVVTFYPAAFSGEILPDFTTVDRSAMMSCAAQIQLIDHNPALDKIDTYAISSSTEPLLELWKKALRTNNINYINDHNYSISTAYNAYNNLGYSNRATYIIDKDGIIVYANPDFTYEDEANFPAILENLAMKDESLESKLHWKLNRLSSKN